MKQQKLLSEIEYLEWLLSHKGNGYTKEFYEDNIQFRLSELKKFKEKEEQLNILGDNLNNIDKE